MITRILLILLFLISFVTYFKFVLRFNFTHGWKNILLVLSTILTAFLACIFPNDNYLILFSVVNGFIGVCSIFKAPVLTSLKYTIHAFLGFTILMEIGYILLTYFFDLSITYKNIISLAIIFAIMLSVFLPISHFVPKDCFHLSKKLYPIVVLIELIILLIQQLLGYFILNFKNTKLLKACDLDISAPGVFLISIGYLFIIIIFYFLIYYYNTMRIQKDNIYSLENYYEKQLNFYKELHVREDNTRKFRHDSVDNLLQILFYLEDGKYEEATAKTKSLLGDLDAINCHKYQTGTEILDVFFNYYLNPVSDKIHISFRSNLYPSKRLSESNGDFGLIISNLLRNAIEATMHLPIEKRYINIKCFVQSCDLFFYVENSYDIDNDKLISEKTSKADKLNHGFGLETVKQLTLKHNGSYKVEKNNGVYSTQIMLSF